MGTAKDNCCTKLNSLTLQECLNFLNTGGRHLLLSSISSLPLSQLRHLEQEADKIILRTDKFCLCAIIIQNYAKIGRAHV